MLAKLRGDHESTVALLIAPAGYGKTTLLEQWRFADERPFAWLTIQPRHDDPVLLVASVVAALEELEPVGRDLHTALDGVHPDLAGVLLPHLAEALAARSQPFVLALDDAHRIGGESSTVLAALAEAIPEDSVLALACRQEPGLPLGRLRAGRRLSELHASDLAMTTGEAADLVELAGMRLSDDDVGLLARRTEGWPAGLYLAARSIGDAADPAAAVGRFKGDDRLLADYVRDELLASMAPDDREFMIRTSILDELSGDACDALVEAQGSAKRLRRLSRSNLLLAPLDSRDHAYRCHALLREMLAAELHRLGAREEARLHRRAAVWLAGRDIEEAVRHAIDAGDPELAGSLIWPVTSDYASHGREATLRIWAEAIGPRSIERSPELCLTAATVAMGAGDGAEIEHWTGVVLEREAGDTDRSLIAMAKILRTTGAPRGALEGSRTEIAAAAAAIPETDPWISICRLIEGSALWLAGHGTEAAVGLLEDGARRGARDTPSVEALCRSQLALLALEEGDATAAGDQIDRALADDRLYGLHQAPAHALIFAATALVRAAQGRTDEASRELRTAASLLARLNEFNRWYEAEARIVLARASLLLDDVAGCRTLLADAGRNLRPVTDASVLREWLERAWTEADAAGPAGGRWPLTPAELRLLHLLPTHLSYREIADELFVSVNTVKTQARSIYSKLGVSSRTEAVACARTANLIGDGSRGRYAGPGSPG